MTAGIRNAAKMSFGDWKLEKGVLALISGAQDVADRLASAKPHVVDSYAAYAQFWAVVHLNGGHDLREVAAWKPVEVKRFVAASQAKIEILRKARDYDSSDGLAVWLHTARAVFEPRIRPAAAQIWRLLTAQSANIDAMVADMLADADLPRDHPRLLPKGYT